MKKTSKSKSVEHDSTRQVLLREHDAIERQLAKLKAAANNSDEVTSWEIQQATAVYTEAIKKAESVFDAARSKATNALAAATAKANRVNNDERDAIAKENGPLKRRLQFLKSELRREFVVAGDVYVGASTGRFSADYDRARPITYPSDHRIPTTWTLMATGVWERRRVGDQIQLRRPRH